MRKNRADCPFCKGWGTMTVYESLNRTAIGDEECYLCQGTGYDESAEALNEEFWPGISDE